MAHIHWLTAWLMRLVVSGFLGLLCGGLACASPGEEEVARLKESSRLAPGSFPGLPQSIVADLESRRCKIPQSYLGRRPHNALSGSFRSAGQVDWAIVCLRDSASSILVYWAGGTLEVDEIERVEDASFHFERPESGAPLAGYERKITIVGEPYILDHYGTYGGPRPPPIDHEAINDGYGEKASTVLYWYQGEWLHLTGAD